MPRERFRFSPPTLHRDTVEDTDLNTFFSCVKNSEECVWPDKARHHVGEGIGERSAPSQHDAKVSGQDHPESCMYTSLVDAIVRINTDSSK